MNKYRSLILLVYSPCCVCWCPETSGKYSVMRVSHQGCRKSTTTLRALEVVGLLVLILESSEGVFVTALVDLACSPVGPEMIFLVDCSDNITLIFIHLHWIPIPTVSTSRSNTPSVLSALLTHSCLCLVFHTFPIELIWDAWFIIHLQKDLCEPPVFYTPETFH